MRLVFEWGRAPFRATCQLAARTNGNVREIIGLREDIGKDRISMKNSESDGRYDEEAVARGIQSPCLSR